MKKIVSILMVACITVAMITGCGAAKENTAKATTAIEPAASQTEAVVAETEGATEETLLTGVYTAEINIKDFGTITVEMDADKAPITVTNFVNLVNAGFYDGLTFHRIMEGFMMQGGDPTGTGAGGSDKQITGEFAANGIENNQSHTRGAISMARSQAPNSASSQFFIVHQDSQFLDGQYACFGYVTSGIEVVDAVCESAQVVDDNGTVKPENQPVIESIRILE